jgi:adenylate kinase
VICLVVLLLFGAPGCGKGTQAQHLVHEQGALHLSTGELIRKEIAAGTPLGQKIKALVGAGALVPDELAAQLVKEHLSEFLKKGKVIILDGYPRTLKQAQELDALCAVLGQIPGLPPIKIRAIYLKTEDSVLMDRLQRRVACQSCKTIGSLKATGAFVCPSCGGTSFERRQDDTKEVIAARLKEYKEKTLPIVQVYTERKALWTVDGGQDENKVAAQIKEAVAQF